MDESTYTISVSDLEPTGGDPAEMKADGNAPPEMPDGSQPGDGNAPPDMPSGGEGGQPGGSSSSSVTWTGATEITSGGTYSNQTYTSTTANQNALLIDTDENVTLTNATVTKSGNGDGGDNSSFYGTNAGVLVKGGSTTTINGGRITTSASGANGVFSYGGNGGQNGVAGDGTTVVISNTTINTTGDASGGIMTTGGGTTRARNLTVTTTGQSSAPIRSDRGGGTVSVSGGSYTSSGLGSPAIYSTADITVENASLTSNLSEGVCIEGQNSVALTNCTLTANNTRTNGNAQFLDAVILYQSMSGDSASGTATFSMTGGKLVNKSGHVFHVTNTNAVINLNDVDIDDSGSGVLLSVSDDGWSGASNVATLNASGQDLDGDILVGNDSTLTLNLTGGTTFNGNISGNITNNAGTVISSEVGTVNVSLDSASKWYLDGDAYISSFSGTAANVITNGHTLYVNNSPLSGTTESDDSTSSTIVTALNISNSVNNTLIQGTAFNDTITNTGTRVTIQALGGNDSIDNYGSSVTISGGEGNDSFDNDKNAANASISGGEGNDSINNYGSGSTIIGGAGDDSIFNSAEKASISGDASNDSISNSGEEASISGDAGADRIFNSGEDDFISGGAGDDQINNSGEDASIIGGEGNDSISNSGRNASISGGAGNDYIDNSSLGSNVTIDGGAGADEIWNSGSNASIDSGAGNDTLIVLGKDATVSGGAGNDRISLSSAATGNVIQYAAGDGNDTITGFRADSTLSVGGASYSTVVSGSNVIVSVGDDKITLSGAASLNTVNIVTAKDTPPATTSTALNIANSVNNTLIQGTALNDTITNTGSRVTIQALGGNDSILNDVDSSVTAASLGSSIDAGDGDDYIYNHHSYNPTISGGAGNDSILVSRGHLTYIDGGAGNDSIIGMNLNIESDDWAMGGHATILGGAGADYINPIYANNSSIDGGAGNDTLVVLGKDATVSGGAGNDRITLPDPATLREGDVEGADDVVIVYNEGDGNDVISGFSEDSTLSIGGASYSSTVSGNNMILTVGDGRITLTEATNLDNVNIVSDSQGDLEVATSLVGAMLYRTEEGYPVIAGIAFHPTEYHGDEPTNYASKETWTIESADGLELSGVHYTPENSNDKWVVIIHGYGHNHKHMYPFAGFYLANGYNVLMVDQRAAGDSQGDWLTMGTAESADIALWTQEIARRNSDAKITLFGVSMGAATAMLAAARSDTANVTSLVEDCGYSNVVDIINLFNNLIFQQDQETIDLMQPVSESLTGYNLKDAAPINSIASVTVPSLFITGGDDSVVGTYMLSDLYDASGAEVKETFIVPGAGHGVAGLTDPIGYSNTVFRFVAEADGEGWETANVTDGISLRGTSYNDTITNSGSNVTIDALGGDDYIVNDVDSSVTTAGTGNSIIAGAGNDTIYNHHSYNPTLIGGDGNDSIVVSRGHLTYVDAGDGNDTIIGRKTGTHENDWEIGGYATVLGGAGNDYINTGYSNSASVDGGDGNDTICATGNRITINGGAGSNVVSIAPSSLDADNDCAYVVFSGNTTVQGFKTGWGNGSDTVYIPGDPAGVEFRSGGLTFLNSNDTLALEGVTSTAKVNLYHERRQMLNKGVFIADNEWYSVESGDLSVRSGEEVYFVGPSANNNYGVDFSGISSNLNLTLDTAYVDSEDYVPGTTIWINSVHSIRGGAGNTTIIGSAHSDTIITGTGRTTIDGAGGNDRISLGSAAALVKYNSGGGNDSIYGFNANSTISIGGASYSSATSGSNLILTVGSNYVTLFGAADVSNPHILGTLAGGSSSQGGGSSSTTSGGGSSSTTSGGGSSSTTSGGGSSSTTSGGGSSSTTSGGSSTSTTSGGSSTSTTSGGGSSSTTSGGGSNSSTSGGSSNSSTSGGSSNSSTSGGGSNSSTSGGSSNSSTSGGSSNSSTSGGSSNSTVNGATSSLNGGGSNSSTSGGTSTIPTISGGTSTSTTSGGTSTTPTTPVADYVYTGGDEVITTYMPGEKIALGTAPTSGTFVEGSFVLSSADGNLVVYDALNTVIEFTDGNGNDYIKAYAGTNPGVIDGRNISGFELIAGSDAGADLIFAGSAGSSMWGGFGSGADTLIGGAGTDLFAAGKYQGADLIGNAETKDIINVTDATLSDIVATAEQNGVIAVAFNNGNVIAEQSSQVLSAAFQLADGSKWRYNHATKGWQSA